MNTEGLHNGCKGVEIKDSINKEIRLVQVLSMNGECESCNSSQTDLYLLT